MATAARAIWKGTLKIGSARLPVKLYSGVSDRTVRFHILDDRQHKRVKQHMVSPASGDEVAADEIQKGYEIEPGTLVIITDEELASLAPKPSRHIDVTEFVAPEAISQQWYERPYYLAPDGDEKAYFALVEALTNREREGIAHWVMRNKYFQSMEFYVLRRCDLATNFVHPRISVCRRSRKFPKQP